MHDELEKEAALEVDMLWHKTSDDNTINAQHRTLRSMVNGLHMPILNGMQLFPNTGKMTCFLTSGGHNMLDYALAHIKSFNIGEKYPD